MSILSLETVETLEKLKKKKQLNCKYLKAKISILERQLNRENKALSEIKDELYYKNTEE